MVFTRGKTSNEIKKMSMGIHATFRTKKWCICWFHSQLESAIIRTMWINLTSNECDKILRAAIKAKEKNKIKDYLRLNCIYIFSSKWQKKN